MSQFHALRQFYLDQPHEVSLETFAKCNARCTFCPYPTLDRIGTRLSDGLIDRLIGEMSEWRTPFMFSPFKVNEPFLDKRLMDICRTVNAAVPIARLRLFSNGSPLTKDLLQEVAALENVQHLWISLNAVDENEYERIMGIKFARTAQRLDVLHAMDGFPHSVVLSRVGYAGADEFKVYCAERWPKFDTYIIKQDSWLGYVPPDRPVIPNTPCNRWFELSVMSTGKVSLCCMDGTGEYAIGDIVSNSLLDVYNAPQWRDRRERLISRKTLHPCNTCSY